MIMKKSILNGKMILAVDGDQVVLQTLEKEVFKAAPNCVFYKANEYQKANELLASFTYDLVILNIMGDRGFDLLDQAVNRPCPFPVVMLTPHALNPETPKHFTEMGVRTYLPKEKLGKAVALFEDVLRHEYLPFWRRIFEPLRGVFNARPRKTLVEVQG
jgi:DNA-binding response OmpR family regulator